MTQLTSLNLDHNNLGGAGAASWVPILASMTTLTSLELRDNAFGESGAALLVPALAMLTQLRSLDLSGNGFGLGRWGVRVGPGAELLRSTLATLKQLQNPRLED